MRTPENYGPAVLCHNGMFSLKHVAQVPASCCKPRAAISKDKYKDDVLRHATARTDQDGVRADDELGDVRLPDVDESRRLLSPGKRYPRLVSAASLQEHYNTHRYARPRPA